MLTHLTFKSLGYKQYVTVKLPRTALVSGLLIYFKIPGIPSQNPGKSSVHPEARILIVLFAFSLYPQCIQFTVLRYSFKTRTSRPENEVLLVIDPIMTRSLKITISKIEENISFEVIIFIFASFLLIKWNTCDVSSTRAY